jgi:hypothetical protein
LATSFVSFGRNRTLTLVLAACVRGSRTVIRPSSFTRIFGEATVLPPTLTRIRPVAKRPFVSFESLTLIVGRVPAR